MRSQDICVQPCVVTWWNIYGFFLMGWQGHHWAVCQAPVGYGMLRATKAKAVPFSSVFHAAFKGAVDLARLVIMCSGLRGPEVGCSNRGNISWPWLEDPNQHDKGESAHSIALKLIGTHNYVHCVHCLLTTAHRGECRHRCTHTFEHKSLDTQPVFTEKRSIKQEHNYCGLVSTSILLNHSGK